MEKGTVKTEVSNSKAEGQQEKIVEQKTSTNADELSERLAQIEKTNQRLLAESKDWKSKYQTMVDKQAESEKEKLKEKEDWKAYYEKEKTEWLTEKEKHLVFKKNTINKLLNSEIVTYAPEAHDIELVKQALPRDMVNAFEEDNEIKFSGIKEAVDRLKKEKAFLFKSQQVQQMVSGKPTPNNASLNGKKSLQDMSTDELMKYWKENETQLR